jgi:hypothetical protein
MLVFYLSKQFGSAHGHALRTGLDYALAWAPWPSEYAAASLAVLVAGSGLLVVAAARLPGRGEPAGVPAVT